jgi:GAF domain-containing protein
MDEGNLMPVVGEVHTPENEVTMQQVTSTNEPNSRLTVLTRSLVHRRAEHQGDSTPRQVTPTEVAESFDLVAKFLLATTHASGVAIAILDESGLQCRASAGEAPQPGTPIRMENTISGQCIRSGASFSCEDTLEKCPNALPARSILMLPIIWGRNARGLVALFSRQPQAFSQASGAIARSAAAMLAISLNAWSPQLDCPIDGNVLEADLAEPETPPALAPAPAPARLAPPPARVVAPAAPAASASASSPGNDELLEDHRLRPRKVQLGLPCAKCGSYSSADETICPVCKRAK